MKTRAATSELETGLARFHAGRHEEAVRSLEAVVRSGDRSAAVRCYLAHSLAASGDLRAAFERLREAQSLDPRGSTVRTALGNIMELAVRRGEGERFWKLAVRLRLASADKHLILGRLFLKRRRWPEAERHIREALRQVPGLAQGEELLGNVLEGRGALEEAVSAYREAARLDPRALEPRLRLGETCLKLGRLEEAERHLRGALRIQPAGMRALLALVRVLEKRGRGAEAAKALGAARKLALRSPEAGLRLGEFCIESGSTDEAQSCLERVLAERPGWSQAHLLLGRVFESRGLLKKAELEYGRASGAAEARLRMCELCIERGMLGDAESRLRELLLAEPEQADAHMMMGRIAEERRELEEACKRYRKALELAPDSSAAVLKLYALCLQAGDKRGAERYLRIALADERGTVQWSLELASMLEGQGREKEALRCLQDSFARHPDQPELVFRAGRLHQQAGRERRAKECFRSMLEQGGGSRQRFIAFLELGESGKALREADRFIGSWDGAQSHEDLFFPWAEGWLRRRPETFCAERAERAKALLERHPRSPWPRLLLGVLYASLRRTRRALAVLEPLTRCDEERYGWMRFAAGRERLLLGATPEAVEDLRAAVRSRPGAWWARCRLAEAYLCSGEERECFGELTAAESRLERSPRLAFVLASRGEALLWLGRWDEALSQFDRLRSLDHRLAACWRGAALMLQGRHPEAAEELDRAAASGDTEAVVLRGELCRRMGETSKARGLLDRAVEMGGGTWARVNRALLRAQAGDEAGLWEDFEKVPQPVVDHAVRLLGLSGLRGLDGAKAARLLEAALSEAKGVRRLEPYLYPVWMGGRR